MPLAPATVKTARPIAPPRISLLSSAILVNEDDDRWEGGIGVTPEGCGVAGGLNEACASVVREAPLACISQVNFLPFGIWSSDKTSAFNFQHRDHQARVTRQLQAIESKLIEAELYTNTLASSNPKIQDPINTVIGGGALPPVSALGAMEDALGSCSSGIRMMLHVRPGIVVEWMHLGVIRREGDTYLTPMDNIVVPGRGYSGGPPSGGAAGATEWIYATSLVEVRRGKILVLPDNMSQATNTTNNDTVFWAERIVVAGFDPSCCRLAVEVNRSGA